AQISQASLEQISKMIKIFEDEFKLPKELCIPNWADEKKALENQQAPSTSTVSPEAQQFMMKLVMENVCENVADMIEDLAEQDWGELHADEILLMAAKQVREMAQHKMPNKP
ncbi:MAG: hypothetical protein EBR02_02805, partial [Alphaproteobacteria bacterium]|nr:hypothetical protein [Alphaproteobacteria bacterium]